MLCDFIAAASRRWMRMSHKQLFDPLLSRRDGMETLPSRLHAHAMATRAAQPYLSSRWRHSAAFNRGPLQIRGDLHF
jgi:hypothetical protein